MYTVYHSNMDFNQIYVYTLESGVFDTMMKVDKLLKAKFGEVQMSNYTIQSVSSWLCVGPHILGTMKQTKLLGREKGLVSEKSNYNFFQKYIITELSIYEETGHHDVKKKKKEEETGHHNLIFVKFSLYVIF